MTLFIWIIVFIVSLTILIKASDFFVESAEEIGLFLKIPKFVIGATIVALGTSLPELISSIIAVFKDSSEIVVGNVIGSNITNILFILGASAIATRNMKIEKKVVLVDLPILVLSAALLAITIYDGTFTLQEGLIFILFLIFYNVYIFKAKDKKQASELVDIDQDNTGFSWKSPLVLLGSCLLIFVGAKYTVESVIVIAEALNIGKELIAITAIALGTSLPELIVCLAAAKKDKPEIVLGNVLGSNIFNTLGVMGIPALFGTLVIPKNVIHFALPVMCVVSLIFFVLVIDKLLSRKEGILLVVLYCFFIVGMFLFT